MPAPRPFHFGAVKVHPPMGDFRSRRQVPCFRPVDEEVGEDLEFDSHPWLVVDRVRVQLDGPLGDPTSGVLVADDLRERGLAHHGDGVIMEIMPQLLGGEVHAVHHRLVVQVVLLGLGEHLAQVVHWSLN